MSTTTVRERVHEALSAALAGLPDHKGQVGEPPFACPHFAAEPVLVVCIWHPAAGLLCAACAGQHATRCGSFPMTCTVCDSAPSVDVPPIPSTPKLAVAVQTTNAGDAVWFGKIGFMGTAACRACASSAAVDLG